MISILREKLRPMYILFRPIYKPVFETLSKIRQLRNTFYIPIDKLLLGGNNGIRAAKYAEISGSFLMPSTPAADGPYVDLLNQFDKFGPSILKSKFFENTPYYKRALKCMELTGQDFYDRAERIIDLAKSFIKQYMGKHSRMILHPGQSAIGAPIWVRPIKFSSYYEIIDGHHRAALAFKRNQREIRALIYNKEAVLTPLQQLLLDVLWINKNKWLYQPVESPEIREQWTLVRNCKDRLAYICNFLEERDLGRGSRASFIDVASSYGWFVKEMLERGYDAYGVERDIISIEVGKQVYNLDSQKRIINSEVVKYLETNSKKFDIVSCMSLIHHFVLNKNSTSAVDLIKLLDKITNKILFIDTGQSHEKAFSSLLPEWNDEYIQKWIKKHTSFYKVIPLGRDNDSKGIFSNYYNRTLFACIRG